MLRVLVADSHGLFRAGLTAYLDTIDQLKVVGQAQCVDTLLEQACHLQPDIILLDIALGVNESIDAVRSILTHQPQIGVIVVTMIEDDHTILQTMQAGVRGYILKGADESEMLRAIEVVSNGGALFGQSIANRIADFLSAPPRSPRQSFPQLTTREFDVLNLIAAGCTNDIISQKLDISDKTVRNYVSGVFRKLDVPDRAAALLMARSAGLPDTQEQPDELVT